MSNHFHLLIETGAVGLSKIMQGIQFSYSAIIADTVRMRLSGGQAGVVDLVNIERSSCESVCDRRKTLTENSQ
jgi:hypothetical protein